MPELLKQFIILIASALFTALVKKYPTFPIDQASFVNFFIWLFALFGVINGFRFKSQLKEYFKR